MTGLGQGSIIKAMKRATALLLIFGLATLAAAQVNEDSLRQKIIEIARKYRGVPYVYGAESANAFDCSGFVRWVYREAAGMELPRSSRAYVSVGRKISASAAKPGDIFVFDTVGGAPSHVALYAGNSEFIHAVSAGPRTGVILSPISDRYWAPRVIDVRSVFTASEAALTGPVPGADRQAQTAAKPPAGDARPAAQAPISTSSRPEQAVQAPIPASSSPTPAKPATASGSGPNTLVAVTGDGPTADIGVVIPPRKQSSTDPIPAAPGTGIAFTLTNGTGTSGSFIVIFFRIDPKTYRLSELHQEKITLDTGKAHGLPPFRFDEPGKYRLIVKDNWGTQLVERTFMVD